MSNKDVLEQVNVPVGFETFPGMSSGEPQFTVDIYTYFAAIVGGLLDDPKKRKARTDTIITFNYDLVCDQALQRIGIQPNYHLPTGLVHKDEVEDAEPACGVSLLKLHGSTNWGICPHCERSIVVLSCHRRSRKTPRSSVPRDVTSATTDHTVPF
jgi:hypothetical protein